MCIYCAQPHTYFLFPLKQSVIVTININTSSTVMYCVALEKTGKDYVSCDYPITIFFSFSYSETLLRYVF